MISLYNVCSILCYFIKVGIFFNQTFELQSSRACVGAGESILKSKRILSGDLNDCRDAGFVMVGSENVSNVPIPFVYVIILSSLGSQDVMQIAFSIQNKMIYIRSYNSNLWDEWRQI